MASHFRSCVLGCNPRQTLPYLVVANFLFLLASLPVKTNSLSFNFPSFNTNNPGLVLQGDASVPSNRIQLTLNQMASGVNGSMGRALYPTPIQLWDATTKRVTDFTTQFNFTISQPSTSTTTGDGLTFLLIPENTPLPAGAGYGGLGLFSFNQNDYSFDNSTKIAAVEFDTYDDTWDPTILDHIGIDVNSIKSSAYANVLGGFSDENSQAIISYDSTTKNLSVRLSMSGSLTPFAVSYSVDLSTVLPQRVQVGFSASTRASVELHQILAWSFNSTLEETAPSSTTPTPQQSGKRSTSKGLVAGIAVGISLILIIGVAIAWIILRRKSPRERNVTNVEASKFDIDEDLDEDSGPKRYGYSELYRATKNFADEGKLGEGGFGGVYKGVLSGPGNREIAVKKIKSGSNQGKKEYVAEVKIISRLRHRNLVQLLGWCHDNEELLLVYEFMPNGSLDSHIFGRKLPLLPWATRYKIALGLASGMVYLHEGSEQSVVHRDIKASNVMLDSNFTPKLGDFGLARLADHDTGLQTTVTAGTPGYLAPECFTTGKASKESDVYSFGIVALELAYGRKVIEVKEDANKVKLVEWVWDLYGKGLILEAVDNGLEGDFDEQQAISLMVVGLWCSHPDGSGRPSIKQAIATLNLETPLPSLPPQYPVPIYASPVMNMSLLYSDQSSTLLDGNHPQSATSTISSQQITN